MPNCKGRSHGISQRVQEINNALVFLSGGSLPVSLPSGRTLDQVLVTDVKAGVPSELLSRRRDIREAEHQLRSANANIGAARAAVFSSITLAADGGASRNSLSKLFKKGTGTWLFSPAVNLPIFDRGRNNANLESAEIARKSKLRITKKV